MRSVPFNRRKSKSLGFLSEIIPVVPAPPAPAGKDALAEDVGDPQRLCGVDVWDEIDGQPELVRTLVGASLSGTFGEQVFLPPRVSKCLEDFVVGLRLAGLVSDVEALSQSAGDPRKFRVKERKVVEDAVSHLSSPARRAFSGRARRRRVF